MPGKSQEATQSSPANSALDEFLAHGDVLTTSRVVPPMYRLSDGIANNEILAGDNRILSWMLTGNEEQVAPIAGWKGFEYRFADGMGHLLLPDGTRNARSVLSGKEAYVGEKEAIVQATSDYLQSIRETFHKQDTSFRWVSVGVTPDHRVFIAPPNLTDSQYGSDVSHWMYDTAEELRALLQNDSPNQRLVNDFCEDLK